MGVFVEAQSFASILISGQPHNALVTVHSLKPMGKVAGRRYQLGLYAFYIKGPFVLNELEGQPTQINISC